MLRLFLNNTEVQLTDDVDFTLNKYFEDTSKPTNKYIEFSKTVVIPFSLVNNRLFGGIYSPDRVITYDDSNSLIGIHFDPYKKIDMRLQDNESILLIGYAKMLYIDDKGYSLGLYGELGKVFGELNKLTFDKTKYDGDDVKYFIDGSTYYKEILNKELVYDSWNNNKNYGDLVKTTDANYSAYNIVGWTPLNIRTNTDIFDQKSFELVTGAKTFQSVLEDTANPSFTEATLCNPETAIGDGMMPREIGEFRSYLQQPFMYFDKFYQLMGVKCKELTGYSFNGDDSWFSVNNPYYSDVVFTLKNFSKDEDFVSNTYVVKNVNKNYTPTDDYSSLREMAVEYSNANEAEVIMTADKTSFNFIDRPNVAFTFNGNATLTVIGNTKCELADDNAFIMEMELQTETPPHLYKTYVVHSADCKIIDSLQAKYPYAQFIVGTFIEKQGNMVLDIPLNNCVFYASSLNVSGQFFLSGHFVNNKWPLSQRQQSVTVIRFGTFQGGGVTLGANVYKSYYRSGSNVTLNDLWNNDYEPFTLLMNYCKLFRIGIFADNVNKQIKFIPYTNYFSNYTITDWSDKLDKSLDFQVKPITYDNKWVKFNYKDNGYDINELYSNKFGLNFGEYKIDTHYVFNDETEDLFDDINSPVENTDNVLSWGNLYDRKKVEYSFPAEKYICPKDKDNKIQDNFGTFYFDGKVTAFDTEETLHLREVDISDDSQTQRGSGKFYYSQRANNSAYVKRTVNYHQLSSFIGKYMITYTVPSYSFCWQDYTGKMGIYETFWDAYLNERYNVQNKIVTCYLRLKSSDFIGFEYNKFIIIDNQLYFVNKIFDFNPSDDEPTKVELITIQDINGYVKDNYNPYIKITPENLNMGHTDTSYVDVESTQNVFVTASVPIYLDGKLLNNATPITITEGTHKITSNKVTADSATITFKSGSITKTLNINFVSKLNVWYRDNETAVIRVNNNDTLTVRDYGELLIDSSSDGGWEDLSGTLNVDFMLNNKSGSGTFNAGQSFNLIRFGQGTPSGELRLYNDDGIELIINIEGEDSTYLKLLLNGTEVTSTMTVTDGDKLTVESSSNGTWNDVTGSLQGLELNNTSGRGSFTRGTTIFNLTTPYGGGDTGQLNFSNNEGLELEIDVIVK